MSLSPEDGVKLAHEKLRRIESELNSLPESESVEKVREELDAALQSTIPGEVRKRSSLGMFKATEVDKEFNTDLVDDFSTAMRLVPENIDYEAIDKIWEEKVQVVNMDDYDFEQLAEDLTERNGQE